MIEFERSLEPVPLPEPAPADGWQPIETAPKQVAPRPVPLLGWWPERFVWPVDIWWSEDRSR